MQPPHLKHKMSLMKHILTMCTVKQNNYLLYTYLSGIKRGKQITYNYTALLFSLFPILCWKALNITHIQMVEVLHFL